MAKYGTFRYGEALYGTTPAISPTPTNYYRRYPVGLLVHKSVAKALTYRVCKGRQYRYAYNVPTYTPSPNQLKAKQLFIDAAAAWNALPEADKNVWRAKAKAFGPTTPTALHAAQYIKDHWDD